MMKRRSKYSTSGRDSDRKRAAGAPDQPDTRQDSKPPPHQAEIPTPFAGKPLDGSQYLDVIEEQQYSEQRPGPEERRGGRGTPDIPD